jgi:hypothetical protein
MRNNKFRKYYDIIFHNTANILLRFYNELITSVWNILMIIPFDYFLNQSFGNESEYKLTTNYFIFCFIFRFEQLWTNGVV